MERGRSELSWAGRSRASSRTNGVGKEYSICWPARYSWRASSLSRSGMPYPALQSPEVVDPCPKGTCVQNLGGAQAPKPRICVRSPKPKRPVSGRDFCRLTPAGPLSYLLPPDDKAGLAVVAGSDLLSPGEE